MNDLVLTNHHGGLGILTLNRPKALNAINADLQQAIIKQLGYWKSDDGVHVVAITSNHEKAFCSGGDIRQIASYLKEGAYDHAIDIFKHNYELVDYISSYPKTIVSIMNGITMGGGIGLGAFVPYRIVTEKSLLAMPEVMIGLTPDAGSNLLFSKSPGYTGLRAMLTGLRFKAEEAIQLGFADYLIPSYKIDDILVSLQNNSIDRVLSPFRKAIKYSDSFIKEVNAIYSANSVDEIIIHLKNSDCDWAYQDLEAILSACPFSLRVTYQAWYRKSSNLQEILQRDLNLVSHLIQRDDFVEGVRASVVDKDHCPKWNEDAINDAQIHQCFISGPKLYS